MHINPDLPTAFVKDGKLNFQELIDWLNCNSIQWTKANAEAHALSLTERERLLLCIWYYAWQHSLDIKQLVELHARHGTLL